MGRQIKENNLEAIDPGSWEAEAGDGSGSDEKGGDKVSSSGFTDWGWKPNEKWHSIMISYSWPLAKEN